MRTTLAFVFALGLASLLAAAPSFSSSLTPAQRERLGLSGLTSAQLAELDAAVAAFHEGKAVADRQTSPVSAQPTPAVAASVTVPAAPGVPAAVSAARKPIDTPAAAASSRTSGVDKERITARVVGEFRGWSGGTYFPLDNGQVWRQIGAETNELPPRRDAVVEIYPSGSGYWRLRYDGAWITVRRLQ